MDYCWTVNSLTRINLEEQSWYQICSELKVQTSEGWDSLIESNADDHEEKADPTPTEAEKQLSARGYIDYSTNGNLANEQIVLAKS